MTRLKRGIRLGTLLSIAFAISPAFALTDEEVFRNFRFNLINPGARSLALGGAFISLADDATAAQANPGGLAFLRRWEFFAELRSIDNAARASVTSETLPTGIETAVLVGTDVDDVVTPSFISGVTNFERWALGISRQEVLNIKSNTLSSFTLVFPETPMNAPSPFLAEGQGSIDVNIVNFNISAGFRIGSNWGIGATATYSELDVESRVTNRVIDVVGNLSPFPILTPTLDLQTSISDSDSDFAYSLGGLYKREGKWQLGAVYRKTADFKVDQVLGLDPAELDISGVVDTIGGRATNRLNLPDTFGLGGNLQLFDQRLTLALDVERIFYSNLSDNFITGVNLLTDFDASFEIDDGTDYRAGAEWIIGRKDKRPPLALRGGLFLESDATIFATSTGTTSFATADAFRSGADQLHGTIGLGIAMSRIKIDLAADFAETDNEYLVSIIVQGK